MYMYCNNCGEEIKDGAEYCPNCGTKVSNAGKHGNVSFSSSKSNWKRHIFLTLCTGYVVLAEPPEVRLIPTKHSLTENILTLLWRIGRKISLEGL